MRRLVILQTDSVLPEYTAEHGDYPEMFEQLLAATDAEIVTVDVRQAPPSPGAGDAYLITGSKHSVYEPLPWIDALVQFLRGELGAGRKVVGICFGHQLMAHHFGGEVRAAEAGWAVGAHTASVCASEAWMEPQASAFTILSSHKDQVVKLPPGARRFATTEFCPESGFVIDGSVLTFQGHPEFRKAYSETLMRHREALLGESVFQRGIESLATPLDRDLVARWILEFLDLAPRDW